MKIFKTKRSTKKQLRQIICKFAKNIGVNRVVFSNKGVKVRGTYNAETNNIYIDLNQTKKQTLHTLFHELGHHSAVQKNKWKTYHFSLTRYMNVNVVFDIENKIDRIGEKLWYKYVDIKQWGRYKFAYPKSQKNNIIKNFFNKQQ